MPLSTNVPAVVFCSAPVPASAALTLPDCISNTPDDDSVIHNASLLGMLAPIDHYDVPTWYRVMHVNVTAAFALTHVLLPLLRLRVCLPSGGPRRRAREL